VLLRDVAVARIFTFHGSLSPEHVLRCFPLLSSLTLASSLKDCCKFPVGSNHRQFGDILNMKERIWKQDKLIQLCNNKFEKAGDFWRFFTACTGSDEECLLGEWGDVLFDVAYNANWVEVFSEFMDFRPKPIPCYLLGASDSQLHTYQSISSRFLPAVVRFCSWMLLALQT